MPTDSAVAREMEPRAAWSTEAHLLANLADMLGAFLAGRDYKPLRRPGSEPAYSSAEQVDQQEYEEMLMKFRERGGPDGG